MKKLIFLLSFILLVQYKLNAQACNVTKLRVGTGFNGSESFGNIDSCIVDITFNQPYTSFTQISSCSGTCTCSGNNTNFYMKTSGGTCSDPQLILRDFEFSTLPTTVTVRIRGAGVHNYYPNFYWIDGNGNYILDGNLVPMQAINCIISNAFLIYDIWDTTYTCQLNNPCLCDNPTATATQPTCANPAGTITVNTPMPTSGITYTLEGIVPPVAAVTNSTGIFSNLSAGSYSLSVADNSNQTCTTSQSFNINALPLLQSTLNDTICPGISYLFNGQSLTVGGTYYDTLTASSGCDSIITLNLTIDPIINTTLNEIICFGESYNFNGQLLTVAGIYNDTLPSITQCISIATLNLSVLPNLTSVIDTTICNGDSLEVGGNVYYEGGTYNIPLLSQTGCDSSILLKLGIYVLDTLVNTNGNIISSAQNGAQYQWINCDDNTIINNADQQSYTVLEDGIYAVIINNGSCIDTSVCVQIVISGIAKNMDSDFAIYPNPATDWLQITGIKQPTDIHIYNIQGKLIWSIKNQQTDYKLNLKENSISSSMYITEIVSGQYKEYYKLFVE